MRENFPIDPDSIFEPQGGELQVISRSAKPPAFPPPEPEPNPAPAPDCPLCRCPRASADSPNESYAALIRSGFAGRESELTLAMGYLYQSIRFACCSGELCAALYSLALSKLRGLKLLGDLLLSLGSDPRFFCGVSPNAIAGSWWNCSPAVLRYPANLGEALSGSLSREKESAAEFKSMAAYIDDSGIKAALEDIIAKKSEDIELLLLLYSRFCS